VREYGQYCPVSQSAEVVADRWTPLILRELVIGSTRFNDIERGLPGISRTLLSKRLQHLERKGVVARIPGPGGRGSEYQLTPAGKALERVLDAMGEWAVEWLFAEPEPRDIDAVTLMWWMRRRVDGARLPDRRVVLEFDFQRDAGLTLWLVLDRGDASLCQKHPGFEADLVVVTDAMTMTRIFSGIISLDDAMEAGSLVLEGPPALCRGFGRWFLWSPFRPYVQRRVARQTA
jgi:DNA-binding HxlR family transcriptional regulator